MRWQISLEGESTDIAALRDVASFWGFEVVTGRDGTPALAGEELDAIDESRAVRKAAAEALLLLNGAARILHARHKAVMAGDRLLQLQKDGTVGTFLVLQQARLGWHANAVAVSAASCDPVQGPVEDPKAKMFGRIKKDPKLLEIIRALGADLTLQKLRFAAELLGAAIEKDDRNHNYENSFVKHGYASKGQVESFKASIEDPRHSGRDAVHGVARGPLRGKKMSVEEGRAFLVDVLRSFIEDQLDSS